MENKFLSEQERNQSDAMIKKHQKEILSFPIRERINSIGKVGLSLGFKGIALTVEDQDGKVYSQTFGSVVQEQKKKEPTMTKLGELKDGDIINN